MKLPLVYYGLHMSEGVAEYRPAGKDPQRVYVGEEAIRKMNPTFAGRPLFVGHQPEADPTNVKDAEGVVVESFFNKADGQHWAKFLVFTPRANEAIGQGLTLSNCYDITKAGAGGRDKGVDYEKEVLDGAFHHMALVKDPRYANSIVLTPDEFKQYNEEKESELVRLANSKEGEKKMGLLKLFKREKVENSLELENLSVQLPKSGKEVTLTQLVNEADAMAMKESEPQMADPKHYLVIGEEKMTVNDLLEKHKAVCNELAEMKKGKAENEDKDKDMDKDADKKPVNEDKAKVEDDPKKKENLLDASLDITGAKVGNDDKDKDKDKDKKEEKKEDKMNNDLYFDALKDAPMDKITNENDTLDLSMDQFARGKNRYGSK